MSEVEIIGDNSSRYTWLLLLCATRSLLSISNWFSIPQQHLSSVWTVVFIHLFLFRNNFGPRYERPLSYFWPRWDCGGGTWASMSRCLIRVMDFLKVSLSPGMKVSSSSARLQGLVTMNWTIWSFRLLRDWTAAKKKLEQPRRFGQWEVKPREKHARACTKTKR